MKATAQATTNDQKTARPAATTTAAPTTFKSTIEAMRAHHLSRKGGNFFHLNPHLAPKPSAAPVATRPKPAGRTAPVLGLTANFVQAAPAATDLLAPLKADLQSSQQSVATAATTGTTAAADGLKADKDVNGFKARLEAQRKKALDDSDANINAAFDKAAALGEAHPESQDAILAGMNVVSDIISKFTSLISDMVNKVISAIADLLNDIEKTFEDAIGGFSSAAGEVLGGLGL